MGLDISQVSSIRTRIHRQRLVVRFGVDQRKRSNVEQKAKLVCHHVQKSSGTNRVPVDLLHDITFVNAPAAKHLPTSAQRGLNALLKAKMRKKNAYRGHSDSATFALKTRAFLICGIVGEGTMPFIGDMAHRLVDKRTRFADEKEKPRRWDARQASSGDGSPLF